jgi:Uncharacterized protein conserved in bacteria
MLKLNLGAGDSRFEGFISIDKYDKAADVQADICDLPYKDNSVDKIVAYQVIEHIAYNKTEDMFREMYRVLKKGGIATVECPDLEYICQDIALTGDIEHKWLISIYGEYYRPWDNNRYENCEDHEGSKHRTGFTFKKLQRICEPMGFKVERLPWQDSQIKVPENLSVRLTK